MPKRSSRASKASCNAVLRSLAEINMIQQKRVKGLIAQARKALKMKVSKKNKKSKKHFKYEPLSIEYSELDMSGGSPSEREPEFLVEGKGEPTWLKKPRRSRKKKSSKREHFPQLPLFK